MPPKKGNMGKQNAFEYSHRRKKQTITLDSGEDTLRRLKISRYCERIKLSKRIKLVDK